MRYVVMALMVALLTGCSVVRVQPGPAPAPVAEPRVLVHVSGSGDVQSFIGSVPFSAFLKWSGTGTIEARVTTTGVVIYLDGDQTWVVSPTPGLERDAEEAVRTGRVFIFKQGKPAGLTSPQAPPHPAVAKTELKPSICQGDGCSCP